jgi:hypothetical protein
VSISDIGTCALMIVIEPRVSTADPAAPAVQVAHQVAGIVRRRVDLDNSSPAREWSDAPRHRILEGQRAGELERQLVRVHVVIRAVVDGDADRPSGAAR